MLESIFEPTQYADPPHTHPMDLAILAFVSKVIFVSQTLHT